jgi:hypothetical protein
MMYIRAPSMKRPAAAAPTAIPIFAPVLRPDGDCVYAVTEDTEAGDPGAEVADAVLEPAVVAVVIDDTLVAESTAMVVDAPKFLLRRWRRPM